MCFLCIFKRKWLEISSKSLDTAALKLSLTLLWLFGIAHAVAVF